MPDFTDFVALDFETAQQSRESAISLGLVRYHGTAVVDTWYSLIRPPKLFILPAFTAVHGLTVDDVRDAPIFADLWYSAVRPFIGATPVVAHNAHAFDMTVLRAVLAKYRIPVPPLPFFCSLAISRKTWPGISHSLPDLAAHFGIVYQAHNALADARTCGLIVNRAAAACGCPNAGALLSHLGMALSTLA
jgi:DNA polymerase-3 subunit epsilon